MAQHDLTNLKEVRVGCCENLEEIIVSPRYNDQNKRIIHELRNLQALLLDDLPYLTSVFSGDQIPICRSIRDITVRDCPKMRKLPVSIPVPISSNGSLHLQEIRAGKEWWESLEWDDVHLKPLLQPFTKPKDSPDSLLRLASSPRTDLQLKGGSDVTDPNGVAISSCVLGSKNTHTHQLKSRGIAHYRYSQFLNKIRKIGHDFLGAAQGQRAS